MSSFGPDFHVFRCMSLPIQLESSLCHHLLTHFGLSSRSIPKLVPKQTLGRSSRSPCFGSDFHDCRCMSLPTQLESFLCGHLLVHFVLSYRSTPILAPEHDFGGDPVARHASDQTFTFAGAGLSAHAAGVIFFAATCSCIVSCHINFSPYLFNATCRRPSPCRQHHLQNSTLAPITVQRIYQIIT